MTKTKPTNNMKVSSLADRAKAAITKGQIATAIAEFSEVIALQPENTTALYWRGMLYLYNGQFELARADFEKALEIMPRYLDARNGLGLIANMQEDYAEVERITSELIVEQPDYVDALISRSHARLKLGKLDEALQDAETILRFSRGNVIGVANKAAILARMGRYQEALPLVNREIKRIPYHFGGYDTRAVIRRGLKDYKGALEDHAKALSMAPDFATLYEERAQTYQAMGDEARAQADLAHAQYLRENMRAMQYRVGIISPPPPTRTPNWVKLGIGVGVFLCLVSFVLPYLMQALLVGFTLAGANDFDKRQTQYRQTQDAQIALVTQQISAKPDEISLYVKRGKLYLYNQHPDDALRDFDKASSLNPNSAAGFQGRAEAFAQKRDYARAAAEYQTLLRLVPDLYDRDSIERYINAYQRRANQTGTPDPNDPLDDTDFYD
jgi:tetratricopeptide (TPR) repeat protein